MSVSDVKNHAVVLKQRPQGEIQSGDLVMEERPVRAPGEGEVVAQVLWLSLDPYMRPRMNDAKGYMDPIAIDEVIVGESVARIVESRSDTLKVGDLVTCYSGGSSAGRGAEGVNEVLLVVTKFEMIVHKGTSILYDSHLFELTEIKSMTPDTAELKFENFIIVFKSPFVDAIIDAVRKVRLFVV